MTTGRIEGDSVTAGVGAATGYVSRLSALLGQTVKNCGVSGYNVTSAHWSVANPGGSPNYPIADWYGIALGINDERFWNTSALIDCFGGALASEALWPCCVNKITASVGTGWTFTGSWSAASVYFGFGKTGSAGAKIAGTATGTALAFSAIRFANTAGQYTIKIDGTVYGPFSTQAAGAYVDTSYQYPHMTFLHLFHGLSSGTHAWEFEVASGSATLEWVSGNTGAMKPTYIANVPYALSYPSGGSNSNVDALNAKIADWVSRLGAAGFPVYLVDVQSITAMSDYTSADPYHPKDSWHSKAAQKWADTISNVSPPPPPTYSPAVIEMDVSGNFFGRLATDNFGVTRRQLN